MNPSKFAAYFPTSAKASGAGTDQLKIGTLITDASTDLLDTVINEVGILPLSIFVFDRFTSPSSLVAVPNFRNPPKSRNIEVSTNTNLKKVVYQLVSEPNRMLNTKISVLQDDVAIISKMKTLASEPVTYSYFFYNMDTDKSIIGKFSTDDSITTIMANFKEFISMFTEESYVLPVSFLDGKVTFK